MIPSIVILLLGVIIAIGSVSFLSPCIHEDGNYGACHWAGQALLGLGCVIAVQSLMAIVFPKYRRGVYMGIVPVSAMGILTPGTLISICKMDTMRCRMIMRPAMILLFIAVLLTALIGTILTKDERVER